MRRHILLVLLVALVLTSGTLTSYAATKVLITSTKQVKNGSLQAADLSAKARASLTGQKGATGPAGAQGPVGPSHAYADQRTTDVVLPTGGDPSLSVVSVEVPAGSYVVSARLQGVTGFTPPGNNFRFDCDLVGPDATFDSVVYRVGTDVGVERYLTFQGAGTTTTAGTIELICREGNGHPDVEVDTASLTAIQVAAVN